MATGSDFRPAGRVMEHDVLSMLLVGAGLFVIAGIVRNLLSRRLAPASIGQPRDRLR